MASQEIKGLGNVDALLKRFKAAKKYWDLWRSLHQEAYDFAAPQRETFRFHAPGQRKNRHVYDSTAVLGLEQFANRIQASVIPPWHNWMSLAPGTEVPEDQRSPDVEKGLEAITKTFFSELNHSNFSSEISPALVDLGIGTGAVLMEEGKFGKEAFKFTNIPLAELYPEETIRGCIDSSWRQQEIEGRLIKVTWPEADIPYKLENEITTKPDNKVKIITGMLKNYADDMFWHIVIHEPSKHILFQQSFKKKRLIIFRWHVVPGETFGRGPIIQMLPDIRTVNKVKEFTLKNAALQMSGVYTGVDDGIFNPHTVRILPGGVIPVSSNNSSNPSLVPLERSGDIGLGGMIMEDLQNGIKKALFVDPLGDIQDPVRSATEQMIRQQEMLKNAGASLGRLKTELVEPLVAAGIEILSELGKAPKIEVDGKEVTLRQESPLARAEDIEDFQNSQLWFSAVSALPQEIFVGAVKVEELPGYWAEKLGVPQKMIRDDAERNQIAQAVGQAVEQGGISLQGGGSGQVS